MFADVYSFAVRSDAWMRVPIEVVGVALMCRGEFARVVGVDSDGVLWLLAEGERRPCIRWCFDRGLRVYPTLRLLVEALASGVSVGLLAPLAPLLGVVFGAELVDSELAPDVVASALA